jgi:hypothetical protein
MAETLRDGDLLSPVPSVWGGEDTSPGGASYYDGDRGPYEPGGNDGDLYDLGSVDLPWGLEIVSCPNSTHLDLVFGGSVSTLGQYATDINTFQISPPLAVKSASIVATNMIQLETARQVPGVAYDVTVVL